MAIKKILQFNKRKKEQFEFNLKKSLAGLPDGNYQVYILDEHPLATMSQRGYLFGVVLKIISDESGMEVNALFEIFKNEFGDPTHCERLDVGKYKLTTKMYSTKKMGEFTEKIVAWAREQGMFIPEPNAVPNEVYFKYHI